MASALQCWRDRGADGEGRCEIAHHCTLVTDRVMASTNVVRQWRTRLTAIVDDLPNCPPMACRQGLWANNFKSITRQGPVSRLLGATHENRAGRRWVSRLGRRYLRAGGQIGLRACTHKLRCSADVRFAPRKPAVTCPLILSPTNLRKRNPAPYREVGRLKPPGRGTEPRKGSFTPCRRNERLHAWDSLRT